MENLRLPNSCNKKLQVPDLVHQQLKQGRLFYEILEIPISTIFQYCKVAFDLLESHNYRNAVDCFYFIVTLHPGMYECWLGLGLASEKIGEYTMAIDAYEMAANQELDNPLPYFCLYQCFLFLGEPTNALEAINLAIEYAEGKTQYQNLLEYAKKARDLLLED